MPDPFATLIREYGDVIIRAWADEIYAERRMDLPRLIPYGQLVDHLPDVLAELAQLLDDAATNEEISEAARQLRSHAHVRFRQGALIDEVARELMILRQILNDFLWREGLSAAHGELWELRDALRRAGRFMDELIVQTVVIYAASLRPPVETRASVWPPPRRRKTDFPE
jgi:hypothetical protein